MIPDKRFECNHCGKEFYRYRQDCPACWHTGLVRIKEKFKVNKTQKPLELVDSLKVARYERFLKAISKTEDNMGNHLRAKDALIWLETDEGDEE